MSEGNDNDDGKTFEPTEKRLREAAERGDNPVSREASLLAGLGATLAVCALMLRGSGARLAETLTQLVENPGDIVIGNGADAAVLLGGVMKAAADFALPIFAVFIAAGLAASVAQNAPSVVLDRIAPKLSKISPASGLKRLVGRHGLMEFGKSLVKVAIMAIVAAVLLRSQSDSVADLIFVSPALVPDRLIAIALKLLSGIGAAFLVVASVDLIWTRTRWRKRMMMTRQEVKDEHKQSEGDPALKAKRRSLALDRKRRRMMADVPRATLVIANPTHYAIALRYVRGEGGAPRVVAKGQDLLALKIREIAAAHDISVVENKPLARSMYDHVEVGDIIPPEFYKAVAEVIHFIQSRDRRPSPSPSPVLN